MLIFGVYFFGMIFFGSANFAPCACRGCQIPADALVETLAARPMLATVARAIAAERFNMV